MRIAIITPNYPSEPIDGDFLTMSLEVTLGLKEEGHEIFVVTLSPDKQGEENVGGIRVLRVKPDFEKYNGLAAVSDLSIFAYWLHCTLILHSVAKQAVEEFKPDIVECHDFLGLGLPWICDRTHPVVIRMIGSLSEMMRNGSVPSTQMARQFSTALEFATISGASLAFSLSEDLPMIVRSMTGLPENHFRVIRAPLSAPKDIPERDSSLKESRPFPDLLFWGRIDPQKGCDLLVESLPAVAAEFPDFKATFVGSWQSDPLYFEKLNKRVQEMNLTKNVEFTGLLPRAQLVKLAVNSDLCIFPSKYEGACYAALEAMSYGCCVIATAVGGLKEYVQHDVTGWHVPSGDHEALGKAIIKLSNDDDLRHRLSQKAKTEILRVCDTKVAAQAAQDAYKEAMQRFTTTASSGTFDSIVAMLLDGMADQSIFSFLGGLQNTVYQNGLQAGLDQRAAEITRITNELAAARAQLAARKSFKDRVRSRLGRIKRKLKGIALPDTGN